MLAVDSVMPARLRAAPRVAVMGSNSVTVALDNSAMVERYQYASVQHSAPRGQKLMAFQLSFSAGENSLAALSAVRLGVSVAGAMPRRVPLSDTSTTADGQLFIAAVPKATSALDLVLTADGYTQRLSLLTGAPAAANIALLRGVVRSQSASGSGKTVAHVQDEGSFTAHLRVTLTGASVYFFVPPSYAHPASPGDAYVAFDLCYRSRDFSDTTSCSPFGGTDVMVTPSGGRPVRATLISVDGHRRPLYEMPAATTTGTINIAGSERSDDGRFAMTIDQPIHIHFHLRPLIS